MTTKLLPPFTVTDKDSSTRARCGVLYTKHGKVHTPVFMPVATQASVKALTDFDLREMGVECLLSNTYHLYLRPGTDALEHFGGLHKFMNWDRSILTDSGGFQVYSLSHLRDISEEGVKFRSHHDGSKHLFTPENVIQNEAKIGSDIWTCLDVCVKNPATKDEAVKALQITKRWAARAVAQYFKTVPEQKIIKNADGSFSVGNSLLFGIVQGSIFPDLRKEAAEHMRDMDVHGFCLGGLSVGESRQQMNDAVAATTEHLPEHMPRYFMGLGTPEDIWECVERGVDMFDCVWPTRTARNGLLMTMNGKFCIKNNPYKLDDAPIEEGCDCFTCRNYSRGYLCHLYRAGELSSHRLLSIHNIRFLMRVMDRIKASIKNGTFVEEKRDFLSRYLKPQAV